MEKKVLGGKLPGWIIPLRKVRPTQALLHAGFYVRTCVGGWARGPLLWGGCGDAHAREGMQIEPDYEVDQCIRW